MLHQPFTSHQYKVLKGKKICHLNWLKGPKIKVKVEYYQWIFLDKKFIFKVSFNQFQERRRVVLNLSQLTGSQTNEAPFLVWQG